MPRRSSRSASPLRLGSGRGPALRGPRSPARDLRARLPFRLLPRARRCLLPDALRARIVSSRFNIKLCSLRLTGPLTFPQDHRNPNHWPPQNQHQCPPPPYNHRPPSLIGDNPPPMAAPPPGPIDLLALAREGKLKEVVDLLSQGIYPDPPTFYDLVAACYDPKHLEELKKIYESFFRSPFCADLQINNKLLEMFSKCGSMVDACRVFDRMPDRTMESWHLSVFINVVDSPVRKP